MPNNTKPAKMDDAKCLKILAASASSTIDEKDWEYRGIQYRPKLKEAKGCDYTYNEPNVPTPIEDSFDKFVIYGTSVSCAVKEHDQPKSVVIVDAAELKMVFDYVLDMMKKLEMAS